jgi:DNA-binding NarL/FixJ family response regulator
LDSKVLAQARSLAKARAQAARFELDVAVLDLGLPEGSGADLISDLRRASPGVRVMVLSLSLDPEGVENARSAGADETLDKLAPVDEILARVRRLGYFGVPETLVLPNDLSYRIHRSAHGDCMKRSQTRRSRLVMRRIMQAYTNASPLAHSLSGTVWKIAESPLNGLHQP